MELSEEAKQSYLDFCGVSGKKYSDDDWVSIEVSYDPVEKVVTVVKQAKYYDYLEYDTAGFVVEEKSQNYLGKHTFSMVDGATMEYKKEIETFYRQGSDDYGSYGHGDTSDNPKRIEETHRYQMPENFSLEQGLNPSTMIEIPKKSKGARRR